MRQSQLDFLLKHLFDEDFRQRLLQAVREKSLACCRSKWTKKKNCPLEPVPDKLFCFDGDEETLWVLFRTHNDIELRSAVPIGSFEDDILMEEVTEFDKMPLGIQRAIAISIPEGDEKIHWKLFSSSKREQTSIHYLSGMKTFTKERIRADKLSRESREKIKAKKLGLI